MDKQLKILKEKQNQQTLAHITFTNENKQAVLDRVNRKKRQLRLIPHMIFVFVSLVAVSSLYFLIAGNPPEEKMIATISDIDTPDSLQKVAVTGELFTIEWLSDAMDRGNHDYLTSYHSPLVIDPDTSDFKRGDVVYYEISRRPSGLRKTTASSNSLAHRTTWLRSDLQRQSRLPYILPFAARYRSGYIRF